MDVGVVQMLDKIKGISGQGELDWFPFRAVAGAHTM